VIRGIVFTSLVTSVVLAAAAARAADPGDAAKSAARKPVEAWLALVDSGNYAESWDAASSLFKAAMTREVWKAALEQVRAPLGALKERKLAGAQYATALPNAPAGEYVIFQFNATYAARSGVETVTAMKDKDGVWRVAGYFIR